ncbi:hypothetical protein F511_00858 [Dorcoceras hygrometricum]|nr:hypothetical protein F511_00858 [Dorcoceras hygrometricum]
MEPRYSFTLLFLLLFTLDNSFVTSQDEIQQFLNLQNSARSEVGLAPLQWDWNVARYAEWYAYQRQVDCALEHSHGPYGENIFWGSGGEWTPDQAAQSWVDEGSAGVRLLVEFLSVWAAVRTLHSDSVEELEENWVC